MDVGLLEEERSGHQMKRRRGRVREGEVGSSRCVNQYWMLSGDSEVCGSAAADEEEE
jgi:hypothetical protein